jgi:DNA-binding CsgD family transcriptional regulator
VKGRAGRAPETLGDGLIVLAISVCLVMIVFLVPGLPLEGGAIAGAIDASGSGEKVLSLAGEWLAEGSGGASLVRLPTQWAEPYGRAVYRLKLRGLDPSLRYALKLPAIDTSFRLAADGVLVASGGSPGATAGETRSAYAPGVALLPRGLREAGLRLEIANFVNVRGGIIRPILLGEEGAIERADLVSNLSVGLVEGLLFMMGILYTIVAAIRRSRPPLMMGFAYLAGSMAILFISHEVHSWRIMPWLTWPLYDRLSYASPVAFSLLVLAAARSYFGGLRNVTLSLLAAPVLAFELVFAFLPPSVYLKGALAFEAYCLFLLVAALAVCARALGKGYPHAWLVGLGFAALTLETLSAMLFINAKTNASPFLPLSFIYAFVSPPPGVKLAIDLASIALALFAFNAFGVILFVDAAKPRRALPDPAKGTDAALGRCHAIGLSLREADVALLALAGKRNREIAEALGISENTVKTHLSHIFAKAGIKARSELFAFFGA